LIRETGMRFRAIAGCLFAAALLAAAGCGKKGNEASAPPPPPASSAVEGAAAGQAVAGRPMPPAEIRCVIHPSAPSRLTPPSVAVEGAAPGMKTPGIVGVAWFVNDIEVGDGARLEATRFGKGDRIRAKATVMVEGTERSAEAPEVRAVNSPPCLTRAGIEPAAPAAGTVLRASVVSTDPDGDPVSVRYAWYVDDRKVAEGADSFKLAGARKGARVHVQAYPNDGTADGGWISSPRYTVVNAAPVVKDGPPGALGPDRKFSHAIVAEDPDGDPLTYTLKKGPPGMDLNGSTLEWEVPEAFFGQSVEVVVEVSDGEESRTVHTISMTVQPPK